MNSFTLFLCSLFFCKTHSYIYHSYRALRQPYSILYNSKSHKEIKKIDDSVALILASHWYDELKICQNEPFQSNASNERQNIRFLYDINDDEYMKMSNLMTFHYNIQNDVDTHMEYLIWKPKMHQVSLDEKITNSIVYPCFRQSMCLIRFQRSNNNVTIYDIIFNPFWNGETKKTRQQLKKVLIHYFITYMKHKKITFE